MSTMRAPGRMAVLRSRFELAAIPASIVPRCAVPDGAWVRRAAGCSAGIATPSPPGKRVMRADAAACGDRGNGALSRGARGVAAPDTPRPHCAGSCTRVRVAPPEPLDNGRVAPSPVAFGSVSYTHLRAHETP